MAIQEQKYLIVHEQNLSPKVIADIMAESKVVLNLSSNLHEGLHERIPMALLNGAICVTDQNNYVMEEFGNKGALELFSWEHTKNLSGRIKKILQNQENSAERSELASQIANRKYTVACFWQQIRDWDKGE